MRYINLAGLILCDILVALSITGFYHLMCEYRHVELFALAAIVFSTLAMVFWVLCLIFGDKRMIVWSMIPGLLGTLSFVAVFFTVIRQIVTR